ncbi:hypothetical protein J2T57_001517 [Natronocella acetinitrilica]|uniref:Uncharacterized protein n=1 Tax=Natronocella acetinitrilica TaxID=414046 RepID=A0AAE3G2A9_9GAMM|nr:hypothetical protein [Natronocella acetinitrilica]MCP1674415.1 hypothetical protein [Natronocella acetinitrilica]
MTDQTIPTPGRLKADARKTLRALRAGRMAPDACGLAPDTDLGRLRLKDLLALKARECGCSDWTELVRTRERQVAGQRARAGAPSGQAAATPEDSGAEPAHECEQWYLTEHGWRAASSVAGVPMVRGREVFRVWEAFRGPAGGMCSVAWSATDPALPAGVEDRADALMAEFGDRPVRAMDAWIKAYQGPGLF